MTKEQAEREARIFNSYNDGQDPEALVAEVLDRGNGRFQVVYYRWDVATQRRVYQ